jgi:hypothetical protein
MENNVILGTAWGYKFDQVAVFVESWKKYCSDTKLILLIEPDVKQEKYDWLLDMGVDVRFFTAGYFVPSAIHNTRYFKYLDILLENRSKFTRVFLTDVRDVALQGDIFAEIDQPGLHCFMEDPAWTCDERFNKYILTTNYGEAVAAEFADKRIICSGTTLGGSEDIIRYIVTLMNERGLEKMVKAGGIPDEQGPHNYIFHKDKLPHTKQENGDGVATICLTHPDQIKILDDGRISVYGKTPAVIHQWDRHPNLVEHYNNIYLKGKYDVV